MPIVFAIGFRIEKNAMVSVQSIGNLRLGDRVIVTSSQGSKAGALRFLGTTEFAAGQWAGVELDDPLGILHFNH